jgi:hypothetical protein
LTAPLLLLLLVTPQSGLPFRLRLGALGVLATGIALWAVPLVLASGGLTGYLLALGSQAGEDFSGVVMLWTHRTARVAALAVLHTLVLPWDSPALAGVMLALAGAGALLLVVRAPRRAALIALLFGPYALFHVLFQETETVRYALPLVVPVTYLASIPLAEARPIVSAAAASALIAVMLLLAVPAGVAYGRVPSPVFRALEHLETSDDAAVIGMHRRVSAESRRARQWSGAPRGELLAAPRDYEWLESTRVWRERDLPAAWFIADPRRTDLALFDPASQQRLEYRWPFRQRTYVGGARPDQVDLVKFVAPGWFLGPGWALTPEVAGITERDGWGPHKRPSVGWVRRRPGETVLMLGGRHLGSATSAPVQVSVAFDQRPVLTLDVQAGPFFGFHPLPAGALAGTGRYSELTATATAGGGASPPVAIEQFDLQDPGVVQLGFEEGWQEPEYNPRTGRSWRWMSERATLGVVSSGRDVTLRITGESSRRYFSRASRLSVAVGAETLATLELANDFTKEVTIPAAPLAKSNGRVTLGADQVFIPGDRKGSADRRRLAVRIYSVTPVAH